MASMTVALQSRRPNPLTLVSTRHSFKNQQDETSAPQADGTKRMADDAERGSGRFTVVQSITSASRAKDSSSKRAPYNPALRLVAIGTRQAVVDTIQTLNDLGYADATYWSDLQRGPNPGEVMSILLFHPTYKRSPLMKK